MDSKAVERFLRYEYKPIVDFALDIVELDDKELEAVKLCGRKRMTIEAAAEMAQVSTNTMQSRWSSARRRLARAWGGMEWIELIAETVKE